MDGSAAARREESAMETETLAITQELTATRSRRRKARGVFEKVHNSGIWWCEYFDATGRRRREKVGTWAAARDLYITRKNAAIEGKKLPARLRRRVVPFSELCDDAKAYIHENYSRPQHDLGRLAKIKEWFGSHSAESIEAREIRAVLDRTAREGKWSHSSFNHYHTIISLIYRLGIENGKVNQNPAHAVRRKGESNARVRFLTAEEEAKLRKAIRCNDAWREHEPELTLALNTGLRRRSMYIDLLWEHIDLEGRLATVPRTKNGDTVHVPLNADAVKALLIFRLRGDGTGRVVRNAAGEPLNYPTHWFVPAVRAAGIVNYKWHDNRHTYASRLRQTGTPLGNIAELLGHKGLAMTRRYAHLSISNLHEAVSRIETSTATTTATGPVSEKPESAYLQ
jgi:integrase